MFSLIAVVCQGLNCVTFTPPVVYQSNSACMEAAYLLYRISQDDPQKELIDLHCHMWDKQS